MFKLFFFVLGAVFAFSSSTLAGPREEAIRLYNRVAGVPPKPEEIAQMETLIRAGDYKAAARIASASYHFYHTNLVKLSHSLGNRDITPRPEEHESQRVPLNDFVATVIGMVRDNVPFDQALYGNVVYRAPAGLANVAAFARNSNQHYVDLGNQVAEIGGLDLRQAANLVSSTQTTELALPAAQVAGLLTTRQAGLAFFSAGTNRRPTRFAFKNFLCNDMEQLSDAGRSDFRVRRDVDRAPSGDAKTYLTSCKGCHAGMDPLSGAWSRFNFNNNQLEYGNAVQGKMNQNNPVFPAGYVTVDDSWLNLWTVGNNARLGWNSSQPTSGNGPNGLGRSLAATKAFSSCMAERAFTLVCVRAPVTDEKNTIAALADQFERNQYNLRDLIENAAILPQCVGR